MIPLSPKSSITKIILLFALLIACFGRPCAYAQKAKTSSIINMVFTSDAHYGISRKQFRGDTNVASFHVNAALISQINNIPNLTLPMDSGVNAGENTGAIDFLVEGGDIANRMEIPNQSAAASWSQFEADYMHSLNLQGHDGKPAKLLIIPGNHDITNAIGFYKPMKPLIDPTSMVKIYNLMLLPKVPMTNDAYHYDTDKINYSRNIKGIHMMFITLWPDSAERIWMKKDLDTVAKTTPVIIFTHDEPTSEAKHFTNPLTPHNMTSKNKFENLTAEQYKEGYIAEAGKTDIEQRGWVKFLKAHANIKAYFHGNTNWNEYYVYKGPDKDVNLNVFRVDSPMKGEISAKDETKLSFQLISIDPQTQTLTVRECLWNTEPLNKDQKIVFGENKTMSLRVN